MKILQRYLSYWWMWVCGLIFLAGCGSAPPVHFYQLSALPFIGSEDGPTTVEKKEVVGIGPVDIPSYVDRAHIVVRAGPSKLELQEFDRWAEPLQSNLTRVLVDNLSQLLAGQGATVLRWDEGLPMDYRIRVEFTQFDFSSIGEVSLIARWFILEKDSQKAQVIKTSRFTGSGIPGDYSSLVSEMSKHVNSLSQELANTLTSQFRESLY